MPGPSSMKMMNNLNPEKHRYRMTVAYDGTEYAGWQTQPSHRTVQGALERVLTELTGETERIQCSGRTDAGVHAREQVAHFDLLKPVVLRKLMIGFNALLDGDIRVLSLQRAKADFHARFSATGKEYRYFIWNGEVMPPFLRNVRVPVRAPLDIAAMNAAAKRLVGNHDFAAFSANPHYEREGTVRHVRELKVLRRGRDITIVARGDGFLYRMVRSLAGFLIRVGAGDLKPEAAAEILTSKVRTARVPTAAPQGLFLWRVHY
jgi:tRNA pseudouridine38-40 synthase